MTNPEAVSNIEVGVKLLPCPFCGCVPRVENYADQRHHNDAPFDVRCDCGGAVVKAGCTSAQAIAAWNRRIPAPVGEVREALTWPKSRVNTPHPHNPKVRVVGFAIEEGDDAWGELGLSEPLAWLDRMCALSSPIEAEPVAEDGFTTRDFIDTASQLRSGHEVVRRAAMSNGFNIILAALDRASVSAPQALPDGWVAVPREPKPWDLTPEQSDMLAYVVHYSTVFCAPENIKQVVEEIDCCPGCDSTSASGSTCYKFERGEYCPNQVAEAIREIGAALYGPNPPSFYKPRAMLAASPPAPPSTGPEEGRAAVLEEALAYAVAFNEENGDPADTLHHGNSIIAAIRNLSGKQGDPTP